MLKIIHIGRSRTLTFILSHEFFILATVTLVVHTDNIPGSICQIDIELVAFVRQVNHCTVADIVVFVLPSNTNHVQNRYL